VFKPRHVPFVLVALLLAVSSPLYFVRGIGIFDDSLYLKAGELILDGLKPYRDFYDNKPPGIYYLSAAIATVGGRGWLAPRLFLFLFAATFQVALVRWVQRQYDSNTAVIAALLIGLSYPLAQGYSLHTEPFGAAAALVACMLTLRDEPALRHWGAAGALLGIATAFKQTGGLYVAAFGFFAAFDVLSQRRGFRTLALTLATFAGGVLGVLVPIAAIFVAQGLGPAMYEAVFAGAVDRSAGPWATWQSMILTWLWCPALVTFAGVALLWLVSPRVRQVMDARRTRAFVLFASVGSFSLLPTLITNLAGHYLQAGAFALSVACALVLEAYFRAMVLSVRVVGAATLTVTAGYFVALCGGSAQMLTQNRLRSDLILQRQLRQTLDARLDGNQTVLCLSINSAAKLHLMSGRRPFNQSLYYYPNADFLFSLEDARRVLLDGLAPSAVVEIHSDAERPELNDAELTRLQSTYEIVPVGPQVEHRLLAFIRHHRSESPRHL